jgi:hypothetical protein
LPFARRTTTESRLPATAPRVPATRRRLLVVAGVVYALLAALYVWRVVLRADADPLAPAVGDLRALYFPFLASAFERLREGVLPLWNPHQACGTPLMADPSVGVLYPLYATFLVLPPERALDVDVAIHLALAAFGAFVLCRHLGQRPAAALLAGVAYAFQGSVMLQIHYPAFLAAAAWIPLVATTLDRALLATSPGRIAALAAVLGVWLLGAYPQFVYFTALALLPLVLVRSWQLWRRRGAGALAAGWAGVAVASLLALAVALPRILPALEFMADTWRGGGGMSLEQASAMAIRPSRFLRGLLTPGVLHPDGPPVSTFAMRQSFVGTLPLLLALVGLVWWRRRDMVLVFAIVAIGAACYALGRATPLYEVLFALPGGNAFRAPNRALLLFGLAIAVLAGGGATAIAERLPRAWTQGTRAVLLVGVALVVLVADVGSAPSHTGAVPSQLGERLRPDAATFAAVRARQGFDRTYAWAAPRTNQPLSFFGSVAKAGTMYGVWQVTDYAVSGHRFERYLDAFGPHLGFPIGYRSFTVTDANAELLRLLGARWLVGTDAQLAAQVSPDVRRAWREVARHGDVVVVEDPLALPRAFVVDDVRLAASPDAALATLHALDPRTTAVVETTDPARLGRVPTDGRPSPGFAGVAEITAYAPERLTVSVQAMRPALLVVTDQWNAGWQATVDGAPAPILRADYLFRGVVVNAGAHTVEMIYAPRWVPVAGAGGLVGVAAIAMLAGVSRRRRARQ